MSRIVELEIALRDEDQTTAPWDTTSIPVTLSCNCPITFAQVQMQIGTSVLNALLCSTLQRDCLVSSPLVGALRFAKVFYKSLKMFTTHREDNFLVFQIFYHNNSLYSLI